MRYSSSSGEMAEAYYALEYFLTKLRVINAQQLNTMGDVKSFAHKMHAKVWRYSEH